MAASKRVTLQDIADALGISRGTVDRVMHGRGRVSAQTHDRIVRKARELGYVPNQSARMLALRQSLHIAVLRPSKPQAFFDAIGRGVDAAAEELRGYGVSIEERFTGAHDYSLQSGQFAEVLDEGFDAIALVAAHRSRLNPSIDEAVSAGVPVVTFNTDAPESRRLLFVGQDLYRSGRVAGELLGRFVGHGSHIAILTGFSGLWAHSERVRGIRDSVAEYFDTLRVSGPYEFYDDAEQARAIGRRILDEEPTIAGFVSTTESGHIGVGRTLLERGLAGKVQNIGFDVDDEIRELMRRDAIQASIGQDPFSQGYSAVKLLFHHLTGGDKRERRVYHTKIEVLLRSTVEHVGAEEDPYSRVFAPERNSLSGVTMPDGG